MSSPFHASLPSGKLTGCIMFYPLLIQMSVNAPANWPQYLAKGASRPIYHMCDAAAFQAGTENGAVYYPPTYQADGFVHASAFPADLVACGNNFYKNVRGDWICISLNPNMLDGEVKYEPAAPVGNIASNVTSNEPKFPHIYGGIPAKSVIRTYKIVRGENGEFLSIAGLVE
jgi:uncharacterized protein (DUF952 family)